MMLIANRYELVDKLGQGGMGTVYRAIDYLTDSTIALKQVNVSPTELQFATQTATLTISLHLL